VDEPDTQPGTPEGRAMIRLLWDPPAPPVRGPKPRLTLDQVVEAAMRVAGELGIDELSMRKVAQRLGVGAMSLYTYVPGKDELFELMIDRAYADRARPDAALAWRTQVEFHARQAWAMYRAHPWLVQANLWRMPLGPHVLDQQEDLYRAVALTGLPERTVPKVAGLVESQVFGAARSALTDTRLAARTGVTYDDYWESRMGFWSSYYTPERFPTMTRIWEKGGFDGEDPDGSWELGLALFLDGVERLVQAGT
jgi:AcrR family transcriptional regulator